MVRGFCRLESNTGTVLGATSVAVRYAAEKGMEVQLQSWLDRDVIPQLVQRLGFTSAFMLRSDRAPEMTAEQRIRGRDASVELVLLVTGYSSRLMMELAVTDLCADCFQAHGASQGATSTVYQLGCLSDSAGLGHSL
jgi:hypothetical protein